MRSDGVYWIDDTKEVREDFATVIFSHPFAQSLWGCGAIGGDFDVKGNAVHLHKWAYHLQQMVIAPDPIEYLEKNIRHAHSIKQDREN